MSVRPIAYDETTKIYTMLHEGEGHQFDVPLDQIEFTDDTGQFFVIHCVEGDVISFWPVSGGADAPNSQLLHSRLIAVKDCSCGLLPAGKTEELCLSHSKLHCSQMDGIDRWQVEQNVGSTLNVAVDTTNQYIVGVGPFPTDGITDEGYSTQNVAREIIEIALTNRYTKFNDGQIEKAERP